MGHSKKGFCMTESLDLAKKGKGILLCLAIAVVAWVCGQHAEVVGGPVFGILFGMLLAQALRSRDTSPLQPGVKFTSKYILRQPSFFSASALTSRRSRRSAPRAFR